MATSPVTTIAIVNFTGALTRVVNGDLNSGLAKFTSSWGYDPFSKPGNLTWNSQPSTIAMATAATPSSILGDVTTSMPLAAIKQQDAFFYFLDSAGRYFYGTNSRTITTAGSPNTYSFDPLSDATSSVLAIIPGTFSYGASMANYMNRVFISGGNVIMSVNSGTTAGAPQSVLGGGSVTGGPLKEFQGNLYFGNGNNVGEITNAGTYGTLITGSKLSPPLPQGMTVTDLDVTPEGDYLLMTASQSERPYLGSVTSGWASSTPQRNYAADSAVFYWNGSDTAATAISQLPSFPATALSTFLSSRYVVIQDAFGAALLDGNQKVLTLPNNNTPLANALSPNGTFLTWINTEGVAGDIDGATNNNQYSSTYAALYYYGKLDETQPSGLWRMLRIPPADASQYLMQYSPLNMMVNNYSFYGDELWGVGKHLIGTQDAKKNTYASVIGRLHKFVLNPGGITPPVGGVYETQTQLFSKRIGVGQVRVYCEPTVVGNAFQLELVGSNTNNFGTSIPVENGTFNYSYGDIVDPQSNSTSVERINFNSDAKTQYSLGIRITNTGTTQMTIKKIELDISEEGK